MEKTLAVINQMQADGVIGQYAIGGAIAAFFYIEPAATYDIDVFFTLEPGPGGLVILTPIYDYLRKMGYREDGEMVMIEGWAVQFLPAFDALLQEAMENAATINFKDIKIRILKAEYLMAISLQTGRGKDFARLVQFVEFEVADRDYLKDILARHHLDGKWQIFENRFLKNQ